MIPYHGRPHRQKREIRRGPSKRGTSHFHAYATANVAQRGQRYTLAMTYVCGDEKVEQAVRRLMRQITRLGVKVRFLLLDKGFFCVELVRYLQAAHYPFLIPMYPRGPRPMVLRPGTLHEFATRKRSGWETYRWRGTCGLRATVRMAIVCRNHAGTHVHHGRFTQLFAYCRFPSGSECLGLPDLSAAVRYRDQLPADERGPHPHIDAQSPAAAAVRLSSLDDAGGNPGGAMEVALRLCRCFAAAGPRMRRRRTSWRGLNETSELVATRSASESGSAAQEVTADEESMRGS